MYLGPKNVINQSNTFKDVRYYPIGCKSEAELKTLYTE